MMKKLLLTAALSTIVAEASQPNIILIYADDLGYGDVGCYGATKVKTPNIDQLAAEGRRFTDAHSPSAVCTPSRYSLVTGEYTIRANEYKGVSGPCGSESKLLINTEKETIASVLQKQGYSTACVGKWHLGFGNGGINWNDSLRPGPIDVGFDYYFGMPVVNSSPPYVYVENDQIVGLESDDPIIEVPRGQKSDNPMPVLPDGASGRVGNRFSGAKRAHELFVEEEVGETFTKKAVEWIKQEKDNPFFLYFATTHIHHPFTPNKRFLGTSEIGLYGDFIHELDWMVGELTKTLEEEGLADNTLIIFTSDNGGMFNEGGQDAHAAGHSINGDLLGFKFGVWEGGHRVPFIAKWPGKIPAGTTSEEMICSIDMLATFAEVTGQPLTPEQQADSVNVLPALVEEDDNFDRGAVLLAPALTSHLGLRKGEWMFIDAQAAGGFNGKKPGGHGFAGPAAAHFIGRSNSDYVNGEILKDAPEAQLYNLVADPTQTQNVYADHPEVVAELRAELQQIINDNNERRRRHQRKNAPEPTPAGKSNKSVHLDFESGALAPWKVVEGEFGNPVGKRKVFGSEKEALNKQGQYYLSTLETTPQGGSSDKQTGTMVSPYFIPTGDTLTFRVGGGSRAQVYVALCAQDGTILKKANGKNESLFYNVKWDLTPYKGQQLYLKVVDHAVSGWGHITADYFEFDGTVLSSYPSH